MRRIVERLDLFDFREIERIERRIREARLPRIKTLEDFDFSAAPMVSAPQIRELAEGGYITRAEPIIFTGDSGTGKTHLATGLCLAACRQKKRVHFIAALRSHHHRRRRFIRSFQKFSGFDSVRRFMN
jgi:DNA replication protein DnaC